MALIKLRKKRAGQRATRRKASDAVLVEIVRNGVVAITEEMKSNLMRTAYSMTIIDTVFRRGQRGVDARRRFIRTRAGGYPGRFVPVAGAPVSPALLLMAKQAPR